MVLLWATLLVAIVAISECQVKFPDITSINEPNNRGILKCPGLIPDVVFPDENLEILARCINETTASNGQTECVNRHKDCSGWGDRGECNLNPHYMSVICPVTCKSCTPTTQQPDGIPLDDQQPDDIASDDRKPPVNSSNDQQPAVTTLNDQQPATTPSDSQKPAVISSDDQQPAVNASDDQKPAVISSDDQQQDDNAANDQQTAAIDANDQQTAATPSDDQQQPPVTPSDDECGQSLRFQIVETEIPYQGDWPWLAVIGEMNNDKFVPFCEGTLISKQHVISAAHCFINKTQSKPIVRLGEYKLSQKTEETIDFKVEAKLASNYNKDTKEDDIILLKLDRPFTDYRDDIGPVCLPRHLRNNNFEEETLRVVGWGIPDTDFDVPRQANVEVIPVKECQRRYKNNKSYKNIIDERQLCAGKGDIDYWVGGSGAPLNFIDISKGRFYVAGIVSFDPRNGNNKLPRVYTRIGSYLDWIDESIKMLG